jgi:hypothetical protein
MPPFAFPKERQKSKQPARIAFAFPEKLLAQPVKAFIVRLPEQILVEQARNIQLQRWIGV